MRALPLCVPVRQNLETRDMMVRLREKQTDDGQ